MLARIENAHHNATDAKHNRRDEHPAHQISSELLVFYYKSARNSHRDNRQSKNRNDNTQCHRQHKNNCDDSACQLPRAFFIVRCERGGEGWNECRTERAPCDDIENKIGNIKRRKVSIEHARRAELVTDDDIAQQTQDAAGDKEKHHNRRGASDVTRLGQIHGLHYNTGCDLSKSGKCCIICRVEKSIKEIERDFGGNTLANTHAAEKADRQNARRRVRNRVIRSGARTEVKNANTVIAEGKAEDAKTATLKAISALDKAAQKGIIKKNNASRRKSRLMKKLNALNTEKK